MEWNGMEWNGKVELGLSASLLAGRTTKVPQGCPRVRGTWPPLNTRTRRPLIVFSSSRTSPLLAAVQGQLWVQCRSLSLTLFGWLQNGKENHISWQARKSDPISVRKHGKVSCQVTLFFLLFPNIGVKTRLLTENKPPGAPEVSWKFVWGGVVGGLNQIQWNALTQGFPFGLVFCVCACWSRHLYWPLFTLTFTIPFLSSLYAHCFYPIPGITRKLNFLCFT